MAGNITFDVIAKDRASNTFDRVGRSADTSGSKLAKLGKFAKVGGLAVAAGAVIAGKAMFDMTKAAIADEAAQKKLATALKNNAGATKGTIAATESWITAQGKALGVTDDELRPALGRLVTVTKDVGKAQKLASLAMDISAGTGKSLQTVTEALMKAQNGSLGGLSRLGVATKDNEGKTKSLAQVTRELAETYEGQAAKAANTTEGKFKRLGVQFDEMKESIGAKLIPIASALADFLLTKLGPALGKAGDWAQKHLFPPLSKIGGFIRDTIIPAVRDFAEKYLSGLREAFGSVGDSIKENRPFLEALGKAFVKVAGFVVSKVLPALGWVASKALPLIGKAIGQTITQLKNISTALLTMAEFGVRSFRFLLNAGLAAFGGILKAAAKGMGWVPGIGGKLKAASASFDEFRERTISDLEKVADKLHNVRDAINGIPSNKTVKVNVYVNEHGGRNPGAIVGGTGLQRTVATAAPMVAEPSSQPLVVQLVLDSKVVFESQRRLYRTSGGAMGIA